MDFMTKQWEQNLPRYERMAEEAVGCDMTVRLPKTRGGWDSSFPGTIVKATPECYRLRGRSAVVQFRVLLRSKTGTEKSFLVEKLPRY